MAQKAQRNAEANIARGEDQGRRRAGAETEQEQTLVIAMSERLIERVREGPPAGVGRHCLVRRLTSKKSRHRFGPALALAVRNQAVEVVAVGDGERVRLTSL